MLWLSVAIGSAAAQEPGNWTRRFGECDRTDDVMMGGPLHLGVRFSTSNRILVAAFSHAMSFWASVVEMDWHEERSRGCAIQVVDISAGLFKPNIIARAQLPGTPEYHGGIAFNKTTSWSASELYTTAVHEIGHILGLPHSKSASSVMYFLSLNGQSCLDAADLAAAAQHHTLRGHLGPTVCVTESPATSRSLPPDNKAGESGQ